AAESNPRMRRAPPPLRPARKPALADALVRSRTVRESGRLPAPPPGLIDGCSSADTSARHLSPPPPTKGPVSETECCHDRRPNPWSRKAPILKRRTPAGTTSTPRHRAAFLEKRI